MDASVRQIFSIVQAYATFTQYKGRFFLNNFVIKQ